MTRNAERRALLAPGRLREPTWADAQAGRWSPAAPRGCRRLAMGFPRDRGGRASQTA
jgi:hypothetical protein